MGPSRDRLAIVVADLGFGDAGKGAVTDALVRRVGAQAVVRFNGGAQAGHNVVTDDGRHHTFAQFGAGSLVPGVLTLLSRFMVVHPSALLVEARYLAAAGAFDAMERLRISDQALVITPFHQAACRLREIARGAGRHGSCGVGVGEAVADALTDPLALRMGDLRDRTTLARAVARVQDRKREDLSDLLAATAGHPEANRDRDLLLSTATAGAWMDAIAPLRDARVVVPDETIGRLLRGFSTVVFEGAQGVLLDEWRGFHPYTTYSTCTFDNALALLNAHAFEGAVRRIGVLRAYGTRHGPGPFPTEDAAIARHLPEPHNGTHPWQGAFRVGWLDLVLLRYALAATGGAEALAVTHLDSIARLPRLQICEAYHVCRGLTLSPTRDLAHQEALTRVLERVAPVYGEVAGADALLERIEAELGVRVAIRGYGPSAQWIQEDGSLREGRD